MVGAGCSAVRLPHLPISCPDLPKMLILGRDVHYRAKTASVRISTDLFRTKCPEKSEGKEALRASPSRSLALGCRGVHCCQHAGEAASPFHTHRPAPAACGKNRNGGPGVRGGMEAREGSCGRERHRRQRELASPRCPHRSLQSARAPCSRKRPLRTHRHHAVSAADRM